MIERFKLIRMYLSEKQRAFDTRFTSKEGRALTQIEEWLKDPQTIFIYVGKYKP